MSKRRKEHWIERDAKRVDEFFDRDSDALLRYACNLAKFCKDANLTPYEMFDMVSSVKLAQAFCQSSKEIFIFDADAANMIGNTDGLPDLRSVLANVPYKTFAVDLGNGTGFIFTCGRAKYTVEQLFGKDSRDDERFLPDRPTGYIDNDGEDMAFNWTPLSKEHSLDAMGTIDASGARDLLNDPTEQIKTAFFENIVAYICSINSEINTSYRPPVAYEPKRQSKRRISTATWHEVGFRLGASIRAHKRYVSQSVRNDVQRQVRPHMRRAHWHHYWTGPKSGPRKLVLKWIAPTLVGVDNAASLSATGHIVEVSA